MRSADDLLEFTLNPMATGPPLQKGQDSVLDRNLPQQPIPWRMPSWMYNAFRCCDFPYALCLFKNLVKYQTQTSEMSSKDGKEQKKPWKSIKRPNHSPNQLEKPPQLCLAVPPSSHQRASGNRSIGDSRWLIERCSSTWNFMSGFPYYPTVPKKTWWLTQREMIHNTSHFATGRNSANLKRPIWMNHSLHIFHKLLSSLCLS